jgi:hypothetical protein
LETNVLNKIDDYSKPFEIKKNIFYCTRGSTYNLENVNTIFQIWERRESERKKPTKLIPKDWYTFVKRPLCNITIKRVGFSSGNTKICKQNDNINTNWFIKTRKKPDTKLITRLNTIKYDTKKNVGAISISKQEIIKEYNKIKRN